MGRDSNRGTRSRLHACRAGQPRPAAGNPSRFQRADYASLGGGELASFERLRYAYCIHIHGDRRCCGIGDLDDPTLPKRWRRIGERHIHLGTGVSEGIPTGNNFASRRKTGERHYLGRLGECGCRPRGAPPSLARSRDNMGGPPRRLYAHLRRDWRHACVYHAITCGPAPRRVIERRRKSLAQ